MTSISIFINAVFLSFILGHISVKANAISAIIWRHQIEGGGKLGKRGLRNGNGVVASSDGSQLWISMDDGSLHILNADNPSDTPRIFEPRKYSGYICESRSSIALYESKKGVEYAVYTVIHSPTRKSQDVISQINLVTKDGETLWYTTMEGVSVGSPVIGNNGNNIYVVHNVKQKTTGHFSRGYLSIFRKEDATIIFRDSSDEYAPFGPLAISTKYGKDTIYWGQAWDSGHRLLGRVYSYDSNNNKIISLQKTNWSVTAAPFISKNGDSVWFGASKTSLWGWTNGRDLRTDPSFGVKVGTIPKLSNSPIPVSATGTSDGSRLFSSSASTSFHCINAKSGGHIWSIEDRYQGSVYMSSPVLSPDETKVYTIRHNDGMVRQINTQNGKVLFQFSCADLTKSNLCHDSVEAEFSLSTDGTKLYYGDIFGNIVALRVVISPTSSPTKLPTKAPTMLSSKYPSNTPSWISTKSPTSTPSLAPTVFPSTPPTILPSMTPSKIISDAPSTLASILPSKVSSISPSASKIIIRTSIESPKPSYSQSAVPSKIYVASSSPSKPSFKSDYKPTEIHLGDGEDEYYTSLFPTHEFNNKSIANLTAIINPTTSPSIEHNINHISSYKPTIHANSMSPSFALKFPSGVEGDFESTPGSISDESDWGRQTVSDKVLLILALALFSLALVLLIKIWISLRHQHQLKFISEYETKLFRRNCLLHQYETDLSDDDSIENIFEPSYKQ